MPVVLYAIPVKSSMAFRNEGVCWKQYSAWVTRSFGAHTNVSTVSNLVTLAWSETTKASRYVDIFGVSWKIDSFIFSSLMHVERGICLTKYPTKLSRLGGNGWAGKKPNQSYLHHGNPSFSGVEQNVMSQRISDLEVEFCFVRRFVEAWKRPSCKRRFESSGCDHAESITSSSYSFYALFIVWCECCQKPGENEALDALQRPLQCA